MVSRPDELRARLDVFEPCPVHSEGWKHRVFGEGCNGGTQRPAGKNDIDLVVAWLREQGAIDYEAARRMLDENTKGLPMRVHPEFAVAIVDAALRPPVSSSQENP